ncbi:MAG: polysaccharide deacetylase family protein [Clostridia bacterium]|nr:polysaccharide deacetylase family protein [Clostridia bacterium]
MRTKERNMSAGAWVCLSAALLMLLVLSRCHAAQSAAAPEKAAAPAGAVALMYHHLLPENEVGRLAGNSIVTTVEAFTQQLDWLQSEGFTTMTPQELAACLYDEKPFPEKAVLITFDDGYLSNAEYAYPLLKERGMTATVFLVTGAPGEAGQTMNPKQVQMMDADAIAATADVFVYAPHTHDLHKVVSRGVSALTAASADTVRADFRKSAEVLRGIPGAETQVFSYPYGLYNDMVREVLKGEGVRLAFRASEGVITRDSDRYALPRFPVDSTVSLSEFRRFFSGLAGD